MLLIIVSLKAFIIKLDNLKLLKNRITYLLVTLNVLELNYLKIINSKIIHRSCP